MSEALLSVAIFCALILGLVLLILVARSRLLPTGTAHVRVNAQRDVEGAMGERLLDALAAAGICLPAACGGKGTCGQCVVTVLREPPPARPTDAARIARGDLARGARLGCQLVLRGDLEIRIPDEIFGVERFHCRVRSTRCVGTMLKEIVADLPQGRRLRFRAGGFVQVTAPPYRLRFRDLPIDAPVRAEWDRLDLWRLHAGTDVPTSRAYSLANHPLEDDRVTLLVRLAIPPAGAPENAPAGIVSSYLFSLAPGSALEVMGPYGHFFADESEREMIFVAGGAGMAPMRSHILDQLVRLRSQRTISFWYGARNLRELFYREEFDRLAQAHPNFRFTVALSEPRREDAWEGEVGFIHEVLLRRHLAGHPRPEECEYYLCGPPLMASATQAMLARLGVAPENVHFDDFGS
jgi:Na+-transporting NADH:ubiquinone oxidoreductase subunit F